MANHETTITNQSDEVVIRWLARTLALVAISTGWFIPEFYDWTGANQSRSAPVIGWIGLGILIADVLLFLLLIGLHFSRRVQSQVATQRLRFSVWHILVIMTLVAVFISTARLTSMQIACWLLQTTVLGGGIWLAVHYPRMRSWIAWTALLQFAPFLWLLRPMWIFSLGRNLIASPLLTGLPAFFPTIYFVLGNLESKMWMLILLTTIEFSIGLSLCYLGPKRALAGGIVLLTLSIFSSFVLNALVRI